MWDLWSYVREVRDGEKQLGGFIVLGQCDDVVVKIKQSTFWKGIAQQHFIRGFKLFVFVSGFKQDGSPEFSVNHLANI